MHGSVSPVTDDVWDAYNRRACGLHYIAHKMRDMETRLRACRATAMQVSDEWLATQPNGIRDAIENIRRNADLIPNAELTESEEPNEKR